MNITDFSDLPHQSATSANYELLLDHRENSPLYSHEPTRLWPSHYYHIPYCLRIHVDLRPR